MSFEDHLTSAMRASVDTLAPPVTELTGAGLRRGRVLRHRRRLLTGVAAGVAALAVAGGATALLTSGPDEASRTVPAGGSAACDAALSNGVLPEWARGGFSDPAGRVPHATSEDGRMTAILFVPLRSPQPDGTNNKILWVERPDSPGLPLHIDAVLPATGRQAARDLGGPGPSIVDLPEPGCWTLTLTWGDYHDVIHLEYAKP